MWIWGLLLTLTIMNGIKSIHTDKNLYLFLDDLSDDKLRIIDNMTHSNNHRKWIITSDIQSTVSDILVRDFNKIMNKNEVFIDHREMPTTYACQAANALGIPYIMTSTANLPRCSPIRIRSSIKDYVEASIQTFEYKNSNLTSMIFLLDSSIEFDTALLRRENVSLEVMIFQLDANIPQALLNLLMNGNTELFTVIGKFSSVQSFLIQMAHLNIFRKDFWTITALDSFACPKANISDFKYVCIGHQNVQNNETISDTLLRIVIDTVEKMVPHNCTEYNLISEISKSETFSELTLSIVELLGLTKMIIKRIATWTRKDGLKLEDPTLESASIFGPILPTLLRIVLIHEPPFVIRGQNGTYTGYTMDVLNEIARRVGFTYVASECPDNQYGVKLDDGSWTGIVGYVAEGFSDVGVGPISVTAERETVIDFSAPYYDYAGLQLLMKDPKAPTSLFIFATVFTEYVWLAWFSLLLGTALLLYSYHRITACIMKKHNGEIQPLLFDLKDSFWFVMASITLAGPEKSPRSFSSRLLVAGFWFFCQIMMATYTANLAAFMTSSRLNTPIKSLEDLATQSGIRYSTMAGTTGQTYFMRMANIENNFYYLWKEMSYYSTAESTVNDYAVWDYPLGDRYTKILSVINTTGFLNSSQQGIEEVLKGNFALVEETPIIKYQMTRVCGLITVGSPFSSKPYAFVLPENSPYVEKFSSVILELQSETFLARLKEKWWTSGNKSCSEEAVDQNSGLTLNTLGGIFIVTAGGCVLGYIILGIEIIINRKRKLKEMTSKECEEIGSNGTCIQATNDQENEFRGLSFYNSSSTTDLLY